KGGNGGGGSTPTPSVNAADPDNLPRGTVGVDLKVVGSGFTTESSVSFEIDGTSTRLLSTNTVTFVDDTLLVANVDVSIDALEVQYDIAVENGPKKKGVGIDLLKVTEPDVTPVVQPESVSSAFVGTTEVSAMSGAWMVGSTDDGTCDFVYNVTTNDKGCVEIPWADPLDDMATLILAVDDAGVIAGNAKDSTGEPIPFRIDYAADPTTILQLERPTGWSDVQVSWDNPINGQGLIVGSASREVQSERGPKHRTSRESVAILWSNDGSIRSMSAPGDYRPGGGLSDMLPDGTVHVGLNPPAVWDGVDGSAPTALDTRNLSEGWVSIIAPDGTIYGTDKYRVVMWASPTANVSVLVDLGSEQGLGIFAIDEHDNLLGRGDYGQEGIFGLCISRADPVRGITKLAPRSQYSFGTTGLGGLGGTVYGHSSQTLTSWDIGSVAGGCNSS
ncbi:MAG: hypothetical protein R3324_07675, partial [Halobacteriales archaeon]|nr:hypothetical protein [Halobacteriales archaeon]